MIDAELPEDAKLPEDAEFVRVTPEFDEQSVPPALLATHRIAAGVWGRLVVREGSLGFRFEAIDGAVGRPDRRVDADGEVVIPPERPHRVVLHGPVRFAVEFHRVPNP